MSTRSRYVLLNAVCLVTAAIGVALYFVSRRTIVHLCQEDGIVENLTSLFYFIASGLFVYGAVTLRGRNVWYWGLALMCFMVAGEEISWGQRIFGVATPDALKSANVQGEMNLHNIEGVHGSVRRLALLVVLGTCFAIPLGDRFVPAIRRLLDRIRMPVYPLAAVGIAALAVLLMVIPRLTGRVLFTLDELGEVYLSIGFLAFGASALGQARRWRAGWGSEPAPPTATTATTSTEPALAQGR
jgi:hypothetical protein